ncbi:MAG: multicopper oxidase domain-containing protein [Pseudomonadota bacterium]
MSERAPQMGLSRRAFLGGSAAASAQLASVFPLAAQESVRPLPIIPMTDLTTGVDKRISLTCAASQHDFGTGAVSQTLGINANYLGPVLRAKQGQTLPFDVHNELDAVTTLHWHGLHIPGEVDGGPHQEIAPDATWSPDVPLVQHASMNWFHSHMHGLTAEQTHKGLAGVLLIEDDASLTADLPKTYGVDDFTLVLQDKVFDDAGRMAYGVSAQVFEDGFEGDTLVVNGALAPVSQHVPAGLVRLRILNACNARFLTLSMATGPIFVIASEGGFLPSLVESETLFMSPGERYEILVDMRSTENNTLQVGFENEGFLAGLFGDGLTTLSALTLTRDSRKGFDGSLPDRLAVLAPPERSEASRTRDFRLQMETGADLAALALAWGNICGGGAMAINGQPMKMDRIDETVVKGETEVWRISVDDMLHPFHIHGCSFRILTQNGGPPPAYAAGWKDMVHVEDGWSEVLVRFDYDAPETAPYMYHCHILEHEDCGMMGQFTVS